MHKHLALPKERATESPGFGLHAKVRREHMRWLCLQHLDDSRPEKMVDLALLALIRSVYPDTDRRELRRELDYLALQGLLTIAEKEERWRLKLTYQGVDVVEFTSHCPPGIGRPVTPEP